MHLKHSEKESLSFTRLSEAHGTEEVKNHWLAHPPILFFLSLIHYLLFYSSFIYYSEHVSAFNTLYSPYFKIIWDFPGGPAVKNPPCNAGDAGSIPGQGTKIPHAVGQLSPHATTTELELLN